MRDIGGFVVLLLVIFTLLYLTVRFVVPLVLLYFGALVVFFILAGILMRKGLRHPSHLNSYLRPGYASALALLAPAIPVAHTFTVHLLKLSDHWLIIGIMNTVPPVLWSGRVLWLHFRQAPRFLREGHDIEELVDDSRNRAGLLDLKIELLKATEEARQAPEPWEEVAGIVRDDESDMAGMIGRLTMDMKQLRAGYNTLADELQATLDSLKAGQPRNLNATARSINRFSELDRLWTWVTRESSAILDERTGFSPSGWD